MSAPHSDPKIVGEGDVGDYRDHISTVDERGKRIWIYPKKPVGRFYNARSIVSWLLLAFMFGGPFLKIGGHPLLLLDFLGRRFYIFGVAYWPQDLYLFGLTLITFIVFLILFTAVFGRIFCGWACPQTIFMEMVFRKIEYIIEGDARSQKKLNESPWTGKKIFKKSLKVIIFYSLSWIIGNVLLAYIIGTDKLFDIITSSPSDHFGGFMAMVIFSFLFFGTYLWFREQVCTLVCPYGRLQGVLLDQNSIVVHYDFLRGDPRGKGKRKEGSNLGDCIDCNLCVEVCPTGIDIRNGTQLECVNCTACMDACDSIMTKIDKPKGLVRYSSHNGIVDKNSKIMNWRIAGYSIILTLLISLMVFLISTRIPIETTILRTPGMLYQEINDNYIRNLYNIKVVNKTYHDKSIRLEVSEPKNVILTLVSDLIIPSDDLGQSVFFVDIPRDQLRIQKNKVKIDVYSGDELLESVETSFIAPTSRE
ncbi:MAG: cytochrome c oxidase accessory protein CcoG [Candidatus Marinimicrobia bacterium]|nr:cytochrome c oxidase accessory protein CcoG [Candidatus Neomarinimicrobiota bacterium]